MSEIPDDVMKAAQAVVLWAYSVPLDETEHIKNVAIAILAERERCARIADEVAADAYGDEVNGGYAKSIEVTASVIAATIRKGASS